MAEIRIYGASDDLVEVEGCEGADEFNVYGEPWRADLVAPGGEVMRVHVHYDGCWHVALGQADESIPFPDWPVEFKQHRSLPYTVVATISAPDGTRLDNISPSPGGGC